MASSSRGGGRVEHDFIYRVARQLASRRRQRGISQESLAATLGMAAKNLQRIESGRQNLSLSTIVRICSALDVQPDALFGASDLRANEIAPVAERALAGLSLLDRLEEAGFVVRRATSRGRVPLAAVPVMTLRAAAGRLAGAARAVEVLGFVVLSAEKRASEGQFVAEVSGRSMAPRIPGGSICLFESPRPPPYEGRIAVVAHGSVGDDELGGPYALKRIGTATRLRSGKTRLRLESVNPEFATVAVVVEDDDKPIIADLARILVRGTQD
jgi:transcriptional regulator with XRE-family HTH domain